MPDPRPSRLPARRIEILCIRSCGHARTTPCAGSGIASLGWLCKPVRKPDAAEQAETQETPTTGGGFPAHIRQAQGASQGLSETPETRVVWLITQRSQVQILPPLPSLQVKALSDHGKGLLRMPCAPVCARGLRDGPPRRLGGETFPRGHRSRRGRRTDFHRGVASDVCDGLQIKCNPSIIDP
jgi:hypothetical protein